MREPPTPFPFVACGAAPVDLVVRVYADYSAQPGGGIRVVRYRTPDGRTISAGIFPGQEEAVRDSCVRDLSERRREIVKAHKAEKRGARK